MNYAFTPDGFYERLADRLLDAQPWYYRWLLKHQLCAALNALTKGIDPATYRAAIQRPVRDGLLRLGAPAFIANVIGAGAGYGLKIGLGQTPVGQLVQGLRVLGALTCPDLGKCPSQGEVVKTFVSPALTEQLQAIARA